MSDESAQVEQGDGPSPAVRRPRAPRHLRRYLILSLAVTVLVTIHLSVAAENLISDELLRKDIDLAKQAAGHLWNQIEEHCIETSSHEQVRAIERIRSDELSRVVDRFTNTSSVLIANVITADGLVISSSHAPWVGKYIGSRTMLAEALADGDSARLRDESGVPFDISGTMPSPLLETYVHTDAMVLSGFPKSQPIVIELYQPADGFVREMANAKQLVIGIALVSFLTMFAAHLWLFILGNRTIVARTQELESLSDHLEEQVDKRTRELATSRRLANVGKLAAGLAHEINTPLASIATSAEGLMGRVKKDDTRRSLEIIRREAFRVKTITRSLLNFSRLEPQEEQLQEARRTPVHDLLDGLQQLFEFELARRDIKLDISIDPRDLCVMADPDAVHQILLNLLQNSIDAVEEGGSVTIDAKQIGDAARIRCKDNGEGIPLEILEQVMDPFVTSKPPGKGTGLGLSLAYSYASRQQGTLTIDSPGKGQGTTVSLFLPVG